MPLETATYIADFVTTNPAHTDAVSQADSHLRLIKQVLQNQFPNIGANAISATAAQINNAARTDQANNLSGNQVLVTAPGEFQSANVPSTGGQFRAIGGNYGAMLRNDGSTVSLLLTNSGSQYGTWNSLRPLSVNLTSGAVALDGTGVGTSHGGPVSVGGALTVTGAASVGGALTVSSGGAAITGTVTSSVNAATATNQLPNMTQFGALLASSGYQKLPSGLILQWGSAVTGAGGNVSVSFPLAFPTLCASATATVSGTSTTADIAIQTAVSGTSTFTITTTHASTSTAAGSIAASWFAIGY
jgi:long-tail fiber proximal subunit/tail fiber protein gp53